MARWRRSMRSMRSCLAGNGADHIDGAQSVKAAHDPKSGNRFSENDHAQMNRWARMRIRTRKLIGTVGLLALVTAWALAMMAFAQFALRAQSGWVAALFYLVAGLGWVLPAMPLVSWMQRADKV